MEVKKQQLLINFNEYNRLKYSAPPAPEGITKIPKPPIPFSSWFELRMFETHLVNLEYEPLTIDYTRKHRYTPDSIIPGTNLLVELKGAFEKDEPGKYESITEQGGFAFLFVFQRRGTEIAWKNPAKMAPDCFMKSGLRTTTKRVSLSIARLKTSLLNLKRAKRSLR